MQFKWGWAFLCGVFFSGCAVNRPIEYSLSSIQKEETPRPFSLSVLPFSDSRRDDSASQILFSHGSDAEINGEPYCINSEKYYRKEPPSIQVSKLIAEHFAAKNAFKTVYYGKNDSADYVLSGNLKSLIGQQLQAPTGAEAVQSQWGMAGSTLITSRSPVNGVYVIRFTDIQVSDKQGNVIKKFPDVILRDSSMEKVDDYCVSVYWNVNASLKVAIDSLVNEVYSGW
jgi:hypothetical protein